MNISDDPNPANERIVDIYDELAQMRQFKRATHSLELWKSKIELFGSEETFNRELKLRRPRLHAYNNQEQQSASESFDLFDRIYRVCVFVCDSFDGGGLNWNVG